MVAVAVVGMVAMDDDELQSFHTLRYFFSFYLVFGPMDGSRR